MKILVIPDLHLPYQTPSFFKDLKRILKDEKPTMIVQVGDLIDSHSVSRHQPEPTAMSPMDEIDKARECIKILSDMIGKTPVRLVQGNHDNRLFKQAKLQNIPSECMKPFHDIYGIPKSWLLKDEWIIDNTVFVHGKSAVSGRTALLYGMHCVQGHWHTKMGIEYFTSPTQTIWSMFVGSASDDNAIAALYARNMAMKSSYGFGIVENRVPRIIPMRLK